MTIDQLEKCMNWAMQVCSPDQFQYRQNCLIIALCKYLIEKDKPKEEQDDS